MIYQIYRLRKAVNSAVGDFRRTAPFLGRIRCSIMNVAFLKDGSTEIFLSESEADTYGIDYIVENPEKPRSTELLSQIISAALPEFKNIKKGSFTADFYRVRGSGFKIIVKRERQPLKVRLRRIEINRAVKTGDAAVLLEYLRAVRSVCGNIRCSLFRQNGMLFLVPERNFPQFYHLGHEFTLGTVPPHIAAALMRHAEKISDDALKELCAIF